MASQLSDSNRALSQWLLTKKTDWEKLEQKLAPHAVAPDAAIDESREILSHYRAVMNDLSLSRRVNGDSLITRYLESLVLKTQEEIYRPSNSVLARLFDLYNQDVPVLMRRLKNAIISAFLWFTVNIAVGWLLISVFPDLISLIASTEMINHVQSGKLWTDDLHNVTPSSLLSFSIATNNITVSLVAFALGAFYGLGTLYILGLNGLMLGGIFAYTASYHLHERLFAFVIGHGIVELSVIIISGAMGFELGEALIRPGQRNRIQAFQNACVNAGKVLLAATPFLIFAGLIEGFVSPNPSYGLAQRILIGVSSGIIFWAIMLFGLPWVSRSAMPINQPGTD